MFRIISVYVLISRWASLISLRPLAFRQTVLATVLSSRNQDGGANRPGRSIPKLIASANLSRDIRGQRLHSGYTT